MTVTRRLAAILAADVAGYSRLIGADEGGTLQALSPVISNPRHHKPALGLDFSRSAYLGKSRPAGGGG